MAVQTAVPLAKPGTEMTAYALPTPDGATASTAAALAVEAAMMAPGEMNAANPISTPQATATVQTAAVSVLPQTANALVAPAKSRTAMAASPQIPDGMVMAAMESDFDTGEPVGLETLVAKRMIVPVQKPSMAQQVLGAPQAVFASLTEKKPTSSRPELDRLISHYAKLNKVPEELVHRVVKRESTYNPRAYHSGNYGLMQIRYNTAKGLGYTGSAEGLFDAETNLKYATKYLAGALMVADNELDGAVRLYASGYYYHAKRKGLLDTLGMR